MEKVMFSQRQHNINGSTEREPTTTVHIHERDCALQVIPVGLKMARETDHWGGGGGGGGQALL